MESPSFQGARKAGSNAHSARIDPIASRTKEDPGGQKSLRGFTRYAAAVFYYFRTRFPYRADVVSIIDGDSVIVRPRTFLTQFVRNPEIEIRMAGHDAPEWDQPGGKESRDDLRARIKGRRVTVVPGSADRYGRQLAHLFTNGQWVNAAQVIAGHAHPQTLTMFLLSIPARIRRREIYGRNSTIKPRIWRSMTDEEKNSYHIQRKREGKAMASSLFPEARNRNTARSDVAGNNSNPNVARAGIIQKVRSFIASYINRPKSTGIHAAGTLIEAPQSSPARHNPTYVSSLLHNKPIEGSSIVIMQRHHTPDRGRNDQPSHGTASDRIARFIRDNSPAKRASSNIGQPDQSITTINSERIMLARQTDPDNMTLDDMIKAAGSRQCRDRGR